MSQAKTIGRANPISAICLKSLLAAGLAVLGASAAWALDLCVISQNNASAIDGVVAPGTSAGACVSDALWASVGPAEFQPDASDPASHLYMARLTSGADRLRIGIDTAGDADVSDFDVVLLFFDADNNNAWTDDKDFAIRIRVSPETSPLTSGDQCNLTAGTVEYFPRTGGAWGANDATAAANILAEYAYDYDTEEVWNLELEIPINTAGTTFRLDTAASPYFAVGGYVFSDFDHLQVGQTGFVTAWPLGVQSQLTGQLPDISASLGNLAASEPDPSTLGNINLENECFDVYILPETWSINNTVVGPSNAEVHTGNNAFRFSYYFDGPGGNATPLANAGTARLRLDPYNTSHVRGESTEKSQAATASQFNQEFAIEAPFNFDIPGELNFSGTLDFVCGYPSVDFPIDDDSTNNQEHINHNYIATSEFTQQILVSANEIPGLNPGDVATVLLNLDTLNEHSSIGGVPSLGDRPGSGASGTSLDTVSIGMIVAGLILILFALLKRKGSKPAIVWLALIIGILLLVMGLFQACGKQEPTVGTGRWEIENTTELGIEPWKDKPGWFQMPVTVGEPAALSVRFVGQPLPYETQTMRLQGALEGQPNTMNVAVTPGEVVTVVARGGIDVDGEGPLPPVAAGGFTEQLGDPVPVPEVVDDRMRFFGNRPPLSGVFRTGAVTGAETAAVPVPIDAVIVRDQRYPMPVGRYQPNQWAGALTAWFHGEQTQSGVFVVGRQASFVVPEGATTMTLFVNAQWTAYPVLTGFYDLSIVRTQGPRVPTRTVPGGDATYQTPRRLPSWHTLTSFNSYTYYTQSTAQTGTLLPLGQAHVSVYASHVGGVATQ
jgi:hypothetical protein